MRHYSPYQLTLYHFPFKSTRNLSCFSSTTAKDNSNSTTPKQLTSLGSPRVSYSSILQGLKHLKQLQQIHAHIITSGFSCNIFLSNRLINCYISCGYLTVGEQIFCAIPHKNIVSWTILISGYAKYDLYSEAFEVFRDMIISGLLPNVVTITSILPALGKLGLVRIGNSAHCFSIRRRMGVTNNVFLGTSLVDMYANSGFMNYARRMFDTMLEKSVATWNAIISGYSNNGFGEEAIQMVRVMKRSGYKEDFITIMSLIEACSTVGCLHMGCAVRAITMKSGIENDDLMVKTALIDMFVKCGCTEDAYRIFDEEIPVKDVITWTLMLLGFSNDGDEKKAMEILNEMIMVNLRWDSVSLMAMFSSCSRSGSLQQGKRVHALTIKLGFGDDTFVGSSIIDMYANCGGLDSVKGLFEQMDRKDVVCWNAMISAYGLNGSGDDAVNLFSQMKESGIEPDEATFICVLCACTHTGMVDSGKYLFDCMDKEWNIAPNLQHYTCIVDLLGRAGWTDEAYTLINNMPLQPDAGVYAALLGACIVHRNIELGLEVSEKLLELEPNDVGSYVLLSNFYAIAGKWEAVKMARVTLRSKKLKKIPDLSSIEIHREFNTFVSGHEDHPRYPEIKETLKSLITRD